MRLPGVFFVRRARLSPVGEVDAFETFERILRQLAEETSRAA